MFSRASLHTSIKIYTSSTRLSSKLRRIHHQRETSEACQREQTDAVKKQNIKASHSRGSLWRAKRTDRPRQTLAERWASLEAVRTEKSTWGDEVEYLVLRLSHESRQVHLSLRNSQILSDLRRNFFSELFDLEACKHMLESQPRRPYRDSLRDLAHVEDDMKDR